MHELVADALHALGAPFSTARLEPITLGESGCLVYRLHSGQETAVLKVSARALMPDYLRVGHPWSYLSEYRFYTELLPRLQIPAPRLLVAGESPQQGNFVLLEDIARRYMVPQTTHVWTTAEMLAVVETYAALHGRAQRLLECSHPLDWLKPDPRDAFQAEHAYAHLVTLHENTWTRDIVAPVALHPKIQASLHRLPHAVLTLPTTFLHSDFYPPNIGLPLEPGVPAMLLDYQLLSLGSAALDIVNIGFLSGGQAFRNIDRELVLRHYLQHLSEQTGVAQSATEFSHIYPWAAILHWADYLPRFVRAIERHNCGVELWNEWLRQTLARAMREWEQALAFTSVTPTY